MAQALTKSPVTSWEDFGGDARGDDVAGGTFSSDSSSKSLWLPVQKIWSYIFTFLANIIFLGIRINIHIHISLRSQSMLPCKNLY